MQDEIHLKLAINNLKVGNLPGFEIKIIEWEFKTNHTNCHKQLVYIRSTIDACRILIVVIQFFHWTNMLIKLIVNIQGEKYHQLPLTLN